MFAHADYYIGRTIAVHNKLGTIKSMTGAMPQFLRANTSDLSAEQLRSLRAQKPDSAFPLGAVKDLKEFAANEKLMSSFSKLLVGKPVSVRDGYRFKELTDKYGVTALNVTHSEMTARYGVPLKLNPFVASPELLSSGAAGLAEAVGAKDVDMGT